VYSRSYPARADRATAHARRALGRRDRVTRWPTSPAELIDTQHALAAATPEPWDPSALCEGEGEGELAIGACVVVFARGQTGAGARGDPAWAAASVLRASRVLAQATVTGVAAGRYVPGLLALREGPCLEAAVRALAVSPDVLLVDATGADHPRRAGLALQLGAVTGLPTIGVTHRPLLAAGAWPPDARGAHSPLSLDGAQVGAWVRTRERVRPVAVHPGWRTTIDVAIEVVLSCSLRHRTPEPLRDARRLARTARAAR
jgi:deoxyribonuclease V